MKNADLSCLKGVYSGGDSLSVELKKRFDKFLFDHHAAIQVREGYGTDRVRHRLLPDALATWPGRAPSACPSRTPTIRSSSTGTQEEVPYGQRGRDLPVRPYGDAGLPQPPRGDGSDPPEPMPTA